jgi:hypothetical protein
LGFRERDLVLASVLPLNITHKSSLRENAYISTTHIPVCHSCTPNMGSYRVSGVSGPAGYFKVRNRGTIT